MEWKRPVVRTQWVIDSLNAQAIQDEHRYALRLLEGLVISSTGLPESLRDQVARLATAHGAVYDRSLELGRTKVLIAQVSYYVFVLLYVCFYSVPQPPSFMRFFSFPALEWGEIRRRRATRHPGRPHGVAPCLHRAEQ